MPNPRRSAEHSCSGIRPPLACSDAGPQSAQDSGAIRQPLCAPICGRSLHTSRCAQSLTQIYPYLITQKKGCNRLVSVCRGQCIRDAQAASAKNRQFKRAREEMGDDVHGARMKASQESDRSFHGRVRTAHSHAFGPRPEPSIAITTPKVAATARRLAGCSTTRRSTCPTSLAAWINARSAVSA